MEGDALEPLDGSTSDELCELWLESPLGELTDGVLEGAGVLAWFGLDVFAFDESGAGVDVTEVEELLFDGGVGESEGVEDEVGTIGTGEVPRGGKRKVVPGVGVTGMRIVTA